MKNKIDSFKKYKDEYKKSVQNPELSFGRNKLINLVGKKNGIQF